LRQAVFSIDRSCKVVSPVSKYSERVFADDIVDKNIFELAFNYLGQKSESFAATKTAVTSVFGEDEVQWSLMEDNFPTLISRRISDQPEKILKMTYTPLYDKAQTVQNIMVVAEDVTELERVKREAQAKQAEVLVIQGLVGVDRGDLEAFLADSLAGVAQCYDLVGTLETDIESRKLLFRILHTIKGNSRLYNLMTISEIVHVAENSVVEINNRLDAKDPVGSEFYGQLTVGLRKIEEVLAAHTKTAEQLFGIKNAAAVRFEDRLHQIAMTVEVMLLKNQTVLFDEVAASAASLKMQYVLSSVAPSLEANFTKLQTFCKYFGAQELYDAVDKAKAKVVDATSGKTDGYSDLSEAYFRFYLQSPRKAKYELRGDNGVQAVARQLAVIGDYLAEESPATPQAVAGLEVAIFEWFKVCDSSSLVFLRFQALQAAIACINKNYGQLAEAVRDSWQCLGLIFFADSSANVDAELEGAVRESLVRCFSGQGTGDEWLDESTNPPLIIDVCQALQKSGIGGDRLAARLGAALGLAETTKLASVLTGSVQGLSTFERAFALFKDGLGQISNRDAFSELVTKLSDVTIRLQMASAVSSSSRRADLHRVFANYFVDESLTTEDNAQQSYEVSSQWYERVSELVSSLPKESSAEVAEVAEKLEELVASIFDYPIKTLCAKMNPMMRDLTKRLGKNINYVVSGDAVAMPRDLAYALRDALVHMLRNSLDHGIEMPSDRAARKKSDVATIEIQCKETETGIEVIVRDDGNGINVEKVVKKAIAMNAITAEHADVMTDEQKLDLIFLSRLSTKEEVSSLSGRGVGMDAVKAIVVERMKGQIKLQSEEGKGTTFRLLIPRQVRKKGAAIGISEVAAFLGESVEALRDCSSMVAELAVQGQSANAGRKMFRILHTMKGSATMHNLKGLADMIHAVESIVAEINISLDSSRLPEPAHLDKLSYSLNSIGETLQAQLALQTPRRKLAPVGERETFASDVRAELAQARVEVRHGEVNLDSYRRLFQRLHTLKGNAQMHNCEDLARALHAAEDVLGLLAEACERGNTPYLPEGRAKLNAALSQADALAAKLSNAKAQRQSTPRNERELFIEGAIAGLTECTSLVAGLHQNVDAARKMFQILHTLKSNAQMLHLSEIATSLHTIESLVANVNPAASHDLGAVQTEKKQVQDGLKEVGRKLIAAQSRAA